jgi:hypothetical protein
MHNRVGICCFEPSMALLQERVRKFDEEENMGGK